MHDYIKSKLRMKLLSTLLLAIQVTRPTNITASFPSTKIEPEQDNNVTKLTNIVSNSSHLLTIPDVSSPDHVSFPNFSLRQFPDYEPVIPDIMLNDGQARNVELVSEDPDADYDLEEEEDKDDEEFNLIIKSGKKRKERDCLSKPKRKEPFLTEYGTPPEFKKPKDKLMKLSSGYLGHIVSLKCPHRKGCPKAKVEWFKNDDPVVASKTNMGRSLVTINKKGDLNIVDNRSEDDGIYTCLISNKFGVIRHDIKVLAVQCRELWLTFPSSVLTSPAITASMSGLT